jgi:glycolate oxidase
VRTATPTIIEEHGVGKLTRPWLVDEVGDEAVELGQRMQFALDPDGIFNPDFRFEESKA